MFWLSLLFSNTSADISLHLDLGLNIADVSHDAGAKCDRLYIYKAEKHYLCLMHSIRTIWHVTGWLKAAWNQQKEASLSHQKCTECRRTAAT